MTSVKFEEIPIQESHEPLVDLSKYNLILEPMYFRQSISFDNKLFLRKGVADKLENIQNKLQGYSFKIWDGYRSRDTQRTIYKKFFEKLKNENPDWDDDKLHDQVRMYVTIPDKPERIPPHSTGGAVDLTVVDQNGKELDMGTKFDYFGKEAAPYYFEENSINPVIKDNRRILREAMLAAGFSQDVEEWWHFDYGNQVWATHLKKPYAIYGEI